MLTTPVASWPGRLLSEYTNSAHGATPRVEDELRALLPRYFELIASNEWPVWCDLDLCLGRLGQIDWHGRWSGDEVLAIEGFQIALFAAWLTGGSAIEDGLAGSLLTFVAKSGGRIGPLLALWDATQTPIATLKLAAFVTEVDWAKRVSHFSVYWDSDEQNEELSRWLVRPEVKDRLEAAFFATEDQDGQQLLSLAVQLL